MADENTESNEKDSNETNLKAEMNRKLSNIEQSTSERFEELKKFNEALLAQVQQLATAAPKQKESTQDKTTLDDIWFDKPAEAAAIIKESAKKEALEQMRQEQLVRDQQNNLIAGLVSQYPELSNPNSKLQKRAIEIYNKMPNSEKNSPHATKVAVMDAAAELGVTARVPGQDDNFTLSGSSGGVKPSSKDTALDPNVERFAEIMSQVSGIDLTTEESKKNLKKHAKRFSDPETALKFR